MSSLEDGDRATGMGALQGNSQSIDRGLGEGDLVLQGYEGRGEGFILRFGLEDELFGACG